MLKAALLGALLAAPALAQDRAGLDPLLAGFASQSGEERLAAAYAACLAGDGDTAATDALFTAAGWERVVEPEMGTVEFTSPDRSLYAMIWDADGFCMVLDEATGTDAARAVLDRVIAAAGYASEPVAEPDFCPLLQLKRGLRVELTSSGNDPVCDSADTSGTRFQWEAAG